MLWSFWNVMVIEKYHDISQKWEYDPGLSYFFRWKYDGEFENFGFNKHNFIILSNGNSEKKIIVCL